MDLEEVIIDGKTFRQVKLSRRGQVAVYTSGELYARVGERGVIERMLTLHKKFEEFGFPVPEIVGQGTLSDKGYFLEKSLGEKCFSYLFQDDIEKHSAVLPELFDKFISVTEKFAKAQLRTAGSDGSGTSLDELIRPRDLVKELPEYAEKILKLYEKAVSALKIFPLVLTQGDFCSHNLFPAGVIDFEKAYYAPAGYDIVTNIFQNDYFPVSRKYEYYQFYSLTDEHKALYYKRLDALYREAGLPKLSKYREHFKYCRAVWHTARNSRVPKLQKWRYELFKKEYLL